jgi:hypothetical protein
VTKEGTTPIGPRVRRVPGTSHILGGARTHNQRLKRAILFTIRLYSVVGFVDVKVLKKLPSPGLAVNFIITYPKIRNDLFSWGCGKRKNRDRRSSL